MASGINVEFLSINSKAFDVSELWLGLGEEIIMSVPELEADVKWFADNDAALQISANGNQANITALKAGTAVIQIQNSAFQVVKQIVIEVITTQATSLGLKAGGPVIK